MRARRREQETKKARLVVYGACKLSVARDGHGAAFGYDDDDRVRLLGKA